MNMLALSLFAIDPAGLGGLLVRGRAGPARDALRAIQRCGGAGGADQRQLPAQAVGAKAHADLHGLFQHRQRRLDIGQSGAGGRDCGARLLLFLAPFGGEGLAVSLKRLAPAHDFNAGGKVGGRLHFKAQAKAIQQLRAQFALFRIAAAHQHKARRMAHAQALALNHVFARRGDVEQKIDEVILQQVYFVDIKKPAMGARQKAGLESLLACRQRAFNVECTDHAVLRRPQRQIDHGGRFLPGFDGNFLAFARCALSAEPGQLFGRAFIGAARDHGALGQEGGERAHGG